MNEKNLVLRLNAVYLILYGSIACYYPFLAVYFMDRGLNFVQIGYGFALNSLVSIIAQPMWGYISDKFWNKKKTLMVMILVSTVVVWSFVLSHHFAAVLSSIVLFMFFQSSILSMCDAFCYEIMEEHRSVQFGRIRLMGSVGFAVIALIMGKIVQLTSINVIFYVLSLLVLLGAIAVYGIHFSGKKSRQQVQKSDLLIILKNKRFSVFLVAVMIICIALGANSSYIAILIEKTGGDVSNLGFLWFVVAFSEIPAFYFGNRLLRKYGELNIFILALALYAVRFILCGISQSYIEVIIVQLLQSVTFPLYLVSVMQYVNKLIPNELRASGIAILSSLGFGLGNFLGNLGGGYVLQMSSVFLLFKLMAGFCLVSICITAALKTAR